MSEGFDFRQYFRLVFHPGCKLAGLTGYKWGQLERNSGPPSSGDSRCKFASSSWVTELAFSSEMTHRVNILSSLAVAAFFFLACVPPRSSTKSGEGTWKFDDPVSTNDFSQLSIIEESLDYSEEIFYEEDEVSRSVVEDNIRLNATQLYLLHREAMNSKQRVRLMKLFLRVGGEKLLPVFLHCLDDARSEELKQNPTDLVLLLEVFRQGKAPWLSKDVFSAFTSLHAHTGTGRHLVPFFAQAITENPQQDWVPRLLELVSMPLVSPQSLTDAQIRNAAVGPYQDGVFWQRTAIVALGVLQEERAVPNLFQTMLSGEKGELAPIARLTLLQMGENSATYAISLLSGEEEPIVAALEKARLTNLSDERAGISVRIALVDYLAALRNYGGVEQTIQLLNEQLNEQEKVHVTSLLPNFGTSISSLDAFKKATDSTNCSVLVGDVSACSLMGQVAPNFFDSSLVPWLLEEAKKKRRDRSLSENLRAEVAGVFARSALRLGGPRDGYLLLNVARENGLSDDAENLVFFVEGCSQDLNCYLQEIVSLEGQATDAELLARRALGELAVHAGRLERDRLLDVLPKLNDRELIQSILRVIDRLSPSADTRVVASLRQLTARMAVEQNLGALRTWTKELLYSVEDRHSKDENLVPSPILEANEAKLSTTELQQEQESTPKANSTK